MVTKTDLMLLLSMMSQQGVKGAREQLDRCISAHGVDYDCLKFINEHRPMEVTMFYEKIRKSYNNKKSKLYINIMRENDENTFEHITTLSAMLTQILLFSKTVNDKKTFLRQTRADEISKVLNTYANELDIIPAIQLVRLIKADIKVLESTVRSERQLQNIE